MPPSADGAPDEATNAIRGGDIVWSLLQQVAGRAVDTKLIVRKVVCNQAVHCDGRMHLLQVLQLVHPLIRIHTRATGPLETGLRVCGFAGLRVCGFAGLRVCGFAGLRFAGLRVCGFAGLRVCGFAGLRVCGFAGLRVCGFAGLRVCGLCGFAGCRKEFAVSRDPAGLPHVCGFASVLGQAMRVCGVCGSLRVCGFAGLQTRVCGFSGTHAEFEGPCTGPHKHSGCKKCGTFAGLRVCGPHLLPLAGSNGNTTNGFAGLTGLRCVC